ncbi:unnamed protein product [Arctia plantaginis]|uniref:Uncharacterized protein n=1 Tax=Arctia plantaginis TaxID=874455 RepID=A0A8S0ZUS1_ARCPL|nr:unnamed protein product [Arctia plantaginis]
MKVVVSTVNFIKSRGLNHRQFKQFLDDIESEYLLYYTEARWLSRGLTLEGYLNLIEEIGIFLAEKQRDLTLFRSQLNSRNYNHFPNYKKMAEKFSKLRLISVM